MSEIKLDTIPPEAGKRYVTRGGWITPPMESTDFDRDLPFHAGNQHWDASGEHFCEEVFDLIAEYVEPQAASDQEFWDRAAVGALQSCIIKCVPHECENGETVPEMFARRASVAADALLVERQNRMEEGR